jgi:hypothetical protein
MIAAVSSFSTGFLAAQAWAWYAFQDVVDGADAGYVRFAIVVGIETSIAAVAFAVAARAARLAASLRACVLAFAAGVFTNAITVGTYGVVPLLLKNDAQLILYSLAVGVLSGTMGWLLAKFFKQKVPNAG